MLSPSSTKEVWYRLILRPPHHVFYRKVFRYTTKKSQLRSVVIEDLVHCNESYLHSTTDEVFQGSEQHLFSIILRFIALKSYMCTKEHLLSYRFSSQACWPMSASKSLNHVCLWSKGLPPFTLSNSMALIG